jgi:hypothetical protein
MNAIERLRNLFSPPAAVQGLWIGESLGPIGQLSIRSFLANGHPFHLYTYGKVEGVPRGAQIRDAGEILPAARIFKYRDHDSYAGFSNHFRYRLLLQRGGVWSDCDVVCLRKLRLPAFAVAQEESSAGTPQSASCVVAAPKGDELMRRAEAFCDAADVRTLEWGQTGPALLTRLVAEFGREQNLLPVNAICPVPFGRWSDLISADPAVQARVREEVRPAHAVHLWHELFRRSGVHHLQEFPPGSLLAELQARYPS